ncbi:MAG: TusE/DsrC/DsvC family sulfur relay protein [Wenzhouxiangella sp.]
MPARDQHGHLLDLQDWNPSVGRWLAAGDGLELSVEHWWLIEFVRDYYLRYGNPPLIRSVVQALKESRPELAGSRHLYRLFPDGPIRLACKYAGLPPPDWCL